MVYLLLSFLCLGLCVLTHTVGVRLKLVELKISTALFFSSIWLGAYFTFLIVAGQLRLWDILGTHHFLSVRLVLSSVVIYLLLCSYYVSECSLVQHESPSMQIIELVYRGGGRGRSYEELNEKFTNEELIISRLKELVSTGFVGFDGGRYFLLRRGEWLARIYGAYRKLIRRGLGG